MMVKVRKLSRETAPVHLLVKDSGVLEPAVVFRDPARRPRIGGSAPPALPHPSQYPQ